HHARMGMSDVHHSDTTCEVDVALAAHIPEFGTPGAVDRDRVGARDAARHVSRAKLRQLGLSRGMPNAHAAIQADTIRARGRRSRSSRSPLARPAGEDLRA